MSSTSWLFKGGEVSSSLRRNKSEACGPNYITEIKLESHQHIPSHLCAALSPNTLWWDPSELSELLGEKKRDVVGPPPGSFLHFHTAGCVTKPQLSGLSAGTKESSIFSFRNWEWRSYQADLNCILMKNSWCKSAAPVPFVALNQWAGEKQTSVPKRWKSL